MEPNGCLKSLTAKLAPPLRARMRPKAPHRPKRSGEHREPLRSIIVVHLRRTLSVPGWKRHDREIEFGFVAAFHSH